ncbi:MAG TPA: phosphatase PAP2 family protein [Gemmatimonadaceae bacterium]|nr:phosphatase PAP2 family protein [Gemmatimonadaceae bacterium]
MLVYALLTPAALFLFFWALFFRPLRRVAHLVKTGAKKVSVYVAATKLGKRALAHARWAHVRAYAPLAIVIAIGAAAALGAGHVFILLAHRIAITTSALVRFDQTTWWFMSVARQPWLTSMFRAATMLGGSVGMGTLVLTASILLAIHKERASALYVACTALFGELLNLVLKADFARARPNLDAAMAGAHWYSFPSGHAMTSLISLGAMSYVAMREKWSWKTKSACLAGALTLVLLIAASRVYLGVHWASDIAGAWTAAIVWLAATTVSFELLLRLRQRRRGERPSTAAADVPDKPVPATAPG